MTAQQLLTGTTTTGIHAELVLVEVTTLTDAITTVRQFGNGRDRESFALLLATDARTLSTADLATFAGIALVAEMHWFSAWGPGCERVHDIVDEVIVELEIQREDTDRARDRRRQAGTDRTAEASASTAGLVMTTWHTDEPLDETLEFFWQCANPSGDQHDSGLRLVITVALPNAADDVRAAVGQLVQD